MRKPKVVDGIKAIASVELNLNDMAEVLMMTPQMLRRYVRNGAIDEPTKKGRYNFFDTYQSYIRYIRGGAAKNNTDSYQAQRSRLTQAKADQAELKNNILAGKLVDIDETTRELSEVVRTVRTRLLSISAKVAMRASAAKTPSQVQKIISDEVEDALKEIEGFQFQAVKEKQVRRQELFDSDGDDESLDELEAAS